MLFFPSFLLGAGGPPPQVMGSVLRHVGDALPLTWVTEVDPRAVAGHRDAHGRAASR